MSNPSLIEFPKIGDPEIGFISVAQVHECIPFDIARVYWTYHTPNQVVRGGHAHKKLKQVLIAVNGTINVEIKNSVNFSQHFKLDNPHIGLLLPSGFWRNLIFSTNAVLVCLASEEFDEKDYIRDFDEFIKFKNEN